MNVANYCFPTNNAFTPAPSMEKLTIQAQKEEIQKLTAQLAEVQADNAMILKVFTQTHPGNSLRKELEGLERSLEQTIIARDNAEEWADKLAYTIGGEDIGEHSSCNNPWANALDISVQLLTELEQLRKVRHAAEEFFKSCNIEIHEDPLNSWWELKQALAPAKVGERLG